MCQSLYSSDNESKKNSVPEEKMKVESLMKKTFTVDTFRCFQFSQYETLLKLIHKNLVCVGTLGVYSKK